MHLTPRTGSCTLQGRRAENEDAVVVASFPDALVCAVADGGGGWEEGGGEAGRQAVAAVVASLDKPGRDRSGGGIEAAIRQAFAQAQADVHALEGECFGYASTLLVVLWMPGKAILHIAHVGGNRAYRVRGASIEQLTTDHTIGEALVAAGSVTREEMLRSGWQHVLQRCLGADPFDGPDLLAVSLEAGDRFLLCTDGLTNVVADDQLLAFMRDKPDAQECSDGLCRLALERRSRDNVSCVVVDVAANG
jgi:protein phosphatase